MLGSRLRSRKKNNPKSAVSSIYINKSNKQVLERTFTRERPKRQKWVALQLQQTEVELMKTQDHLDGLHEDVSCNIHDYKRAIRKKEELQSKIRKLGDDDRDWMTQLMLIKRFGTVTTLVKANQLLRISESYHIDSDRCSKCNRVLLFDVATSSSVCSDCHIAKHLVFTFEDRNCDLLVSKMLTSTSRQSAISYASKKKKEMKKRKMEVREDHKKNPGTVTGWPTTRSSNKRVREDVSPEAMTVVSESKVGTTTANEITYTLSTSQQVTVKKRVEQFQTYLSQFGTSVPPLPNPVIEVLHRHLSSIHFLTSVRCRTTPVLDILRSNGYVQYCWLANRVCRTFNGQPIPVLDDDLILRMVERFRRIVRATYFFVPSTGTGGGTDTISSSRKKVLTFEISAILLLLCEKREDIAILLSSHKTREVLHSSGERFMNLIQVANDDDKAHGCDTLDWSNAVRMC